MSRCWNWLPVDPPPPPPPAAALPPGAPEPAPPPRAPPPTSIIAVVPSPPGTGWGGVRRRRMTETPQWLSARARTRRGVGCTSRARVSLGRLPQARRALLLPPAGSPPRRERGPVRAALRQRGEVRLAPPEEAQCVALRGRGRGEVGRGGWALCRARKGRAASVRWLVGPAGGEVLWLCMRPPLPALSVHRTCPPGAGRQGGGPFCMFLLRRVHGVSACSAPSSSSRPAALRTPLRAPGRETGGAP